MEIPLDTIRYRALGLSETIEKQGRRRDWLAARAGISPGQLTRISNGSRTASQEVAEAIASSLGLPIFLLFVPTQEADLSTEKVA